MKKIIVLVFSALMLTACSSSSAESNEYKAEVKHLENTTLTGRDNTHNSLQFVDNELVIIHDEISNIVKPETDIEQAEGKEKTETTYKNVKVTVKNDMYFIEADNLSMELKRTGKRIISDEKGEDYQTSHDLD